MSRGRRAYDNSSPNTLLVTRSDAIPVLNEIVVAPVTSMIRHIPTCLPVGAAEGINHDSVVVFDQAVYAEVGNGRAPGSLVTRAPPRDLHGACVALDC